MKNKIYKTTLFFIAILVFSFLSSQVIGQDTELLKAIENLKSQGYGITSIEKLAIDSTMEKPFSEKYCINFEQPIDHNNPNIGKFKQRVIIGFAGFERPSEVVTEGYGAKYAFNPKYRDEPSRLFNTNMVFVEHRYFIGSVPFRQEDTTITDEQLNWEYMNAEQAAGDLHNIVSAFKKIFPGKWIASGISKGGQTTMFYRAFYPNDVDISIPYVGPLCKGVEDGRHEPFIASFAGTPQEREIIKNYQIELLKRRKTIEPILEEYNKKIT
jgi:PS-10 peptidase S37.